ncbi:MAG: TatD family hydrolase [Bdellovibrionota bacterium]
MKLIDTHCHLVSDKLKDDLSEILLKAQAVGLEKIINVACDPASVLLALEQLQFSPMLYAALGIQPHDAQLFSRDEGEKIKHFALTNRRVVAIGEIGLDAYYTLSPMKKQIECFDYFLEAALDINLPVIVHVRETHQEVYTRLLQYSKLGLKGVIHCFTGTQEEARQFLDCGFYISFSGIVTFKNAKELQDTAKFVPNEKILIETDSPFLSPMPLRGKLNEPSHIVHTNNFIANLRGQKPEEFANMTFNNALKLFQIHD